MKSLSVLVAVGFLLILVAVAPAGAATVTIMNGDGTSIQATLGTGGVTIGQNGNVVLNINETVQIGSSGTCQYTSPTVSVSGISSSATSGQALSGTISVSSGATVSANYGTVSGSTWSWTAPTVSSSTTYTITLTAINSSQSCNSTATTSYSVNVSPSGGGTPGGAVVLPSTGVGMVIGQGVAIAALGQNNYYFTLPTAAASYVAVMMTTRDWQTNQDVYVSTTSQPSCSTASGYNVPPQPAPWYNNTTTSNESSFLFTPFAAQTTFYVTVCNRSNSEGKYGLYWSQK